MSLFVDTSALLAVLNANDQNHRLATETWTALLTEGETLLCTNYVLVETLALAQKRLGLAAVRAVQEDVVPVLQIEWVDAASHYAGVNALLTADRRGLSLVDCVTFETMRRLGIDEAFTFDPHFRRQGFRCRP